METKHQLLRVIPILLACVAGTVQLSRAANSLPSGVVGYWPGNGDALDHAGTNDGTLVGGVAYAQGRIGSGFSFTNLQDVNIPYSTSLEPANCSIQAWIKPVGVAYGKSWANIFGQRGGHYEMVAQPDTNGGWRFGLQKYTDNGWLEFSTVGGIPTNQFTHLMATMDGTTVKLYTNGVLDSMGGWTTVSSHTVQPFFIGGCFAPDADGYFCGTIDEVAIWNRVLTQEEITWLASWRMPQIGLVKAVSPSFSDLTTGLNYQLQVSGDLNTWTNQGSAFAATNSTMVYPQYWDVDNWNRLFFRLQMSP